MKISCCLIIRNEAKNLRQLLESVRPHVDEICVVDTGSDDGSAEIARGLADEFEVWTGCNGPDGRIADFSAARNRNAAQATGDALLWLDGDDELVGGEHLRKLAGEAPRGPSGAFAVVAPYEYDHDAQGRCTVLQWRERLVGPIDQWEWRGPVHEGCLGKAGCEPVHTQTDLFHVKHRRRELGKALDPERNLRILSSWFARHGEADARLMHYYGAELLLNRHVGQAMYWLRRHVAVAGWSDERCLSLLHLAKIHLAMGDGQEAARYATDAMTTKTWPEPLWAMGQAYLLLSEQGIDAEYNLRRGVHFLERGMQVAGPGPTRTLLMTDPTARWDACAWLGAGLAKAGRIEEAIAITEEGLRGMPEHAEMQANLKSWKPELVRNRIRAGLVELHELGALSQQGGVAIEQVLRGNFTTQREERELPEPRADGKLRIAFFLGHASGTPWTPETLMRDGGGGSETMAWEMARRLAKMGHQVSVYGHCDREHWAEGVWWADASLFEGWAGDVLVVSRQAEAVTLPHTARARVLWVHDVHCGPGLTPQIAARYDAVWALSQWHRSFLLETYPWMPPKKVEVTRNGIDVARFARTDIERNPHRAIYSSSPDRGLREALKAWPSVRKVVPDAELHCFYGFEGWQLALEHGMNVDHPHCGRAAFEEVKRLVETTEGVTMHGKVSQARLAEEMLRSGVWFYPTWFSETSCITAMEAQAAGLVCVCPPLAALAETVNDSYWLEGGEYAEMCIRALKARDGGAFIKERWRVTDEVIAGQDQRRFSLDTLADDWDKRLRALVDAVVPAFSEAAQ